MLQSSKMIKDMASMSNSIGQN